MKMMDVHIDAIKKSEALAALDEPQIIFTPNPEILLKARKNKKYLRVLNKGTLMLPDGHGLLFVSTLLKYPKWARPLLLLPAYVLFFFNKSIFKSVIPELIHGSDFMVDLIEWAEKNDKSVYFLGGKRGVAESCADYFQSKHSGLKIAGASSKNPGRDAFNEVRKTRPGVLLVAYGAPKQELWIAEYAKKLPNTHIMGVGGSFDFWSGKVKRAPLVMRKLGLEWLWRLILNPRQRIKRIWNAVVVFPLISFSS